MKVIAVLALLFKCLAILKCRPVAKDVNDYVSEMRDLDEPVDYDKLMTMKGTMASCCTAYVIERYDGDSSFVAELFMAGHSLKKKVLRNFIMKIQNLDILKAVLKIYAGSLPVTYLESNVAKFFFRNSCLPAHLPFLIENGLRLPKLLIDLLEALGLEIPPHDPKECSETEFRFVVYLLRKNNFINSVGLFHSAIASLKSLKEEDRLCYATIVYKYFLIDDMWLLSEIKKDRSKSGL